MRATHFVGIVTGAILLLGGCARPEPAPEPVRAVKLVTVAPRALEATWEYAGEVRAHVESRLGFRVGGKLVERPVEPGQRVRPGQLLARLDAQDLALSSQSAQAAVGAARTQRDLAAAELRRYQGLQTQGFVSGAEIERRQASLQAAEAALQQALAQSAVQGNQAGYARLVAEAAGVVTAVPVDVGQVVAAGTTVVVLAHDGARDVVFAVPEDRVGEVAPGRPARVRAWAGGEALVGTVREVAASADALTRTYQVKVALPAQAVLPLGATAYVTLDKPGTGASVIKLPGSALLAATEGERAGSQVWVFDAATSTVQPRAVKVAGTDGNDMVIAEGLRPGEEVVAAGAHVLSAGQKVTRFVSR